MILLGKLTINNDGTVTLPPPAGFNTVQAVRLSNYCNAALVVSNIGTTNQQLLLMPVQQNVYAAPNTTQNLKLASLTGADSAATIAASVLVEFSTEPDVDFAGYSYPAQLSVPSQVVAQAIFQQGVPNVLRQDILEFFNPFNAGTSFVINNIGQYASLILQLSGTLANVQADYHQNTPYSGLDFPNREYYTNILGASYVNTWQIPVNAQSVQMSNLGPNPAAIVVYGSNRAVNSQRQVGLGNVTRLLQFLGNVTSGVNVDLSAIDGTGVRATTLNGLCTWTITPNVAGTIQAFWIDPSNATRVAVVSGALVSSVSASGTFAHPACPVIWQYHPTATVAGANLALLLSQN